MPAYYDKQANTWYVKCYYTNYKGEKHQHKKRGFARKKDALEHERDFLKSKSADLTMTFSEFVKIYNDDMRPRLREHTYVQKQYIIETKLIPYFGSKPISAITPADIRKWQNDLMEYKDEKGKPYSQTYLKTINNQITAIFNFAVRYYGLNQNPCRIAGSMGKSHAEEMNFWTAREFKTFLSIIENKPTSKTGFSILFYCGLRIGKMLALTLEDIDFNNNTININKSFQRIHGKDVITPPKTPKSIRTISVPANLMNDIKDYTKKIYGLKKGDRIFPYTKSYFEHEIKRGIEKSGVKNIRLHDLRHSHASLLIEMGFPALLIADRLGHEKVETTLNTYSHLFPNKRETVGKMLNEYY